jgi:ubiquinone/menaquinone biosynthesis C-methylase UbiE
MHRLELTRSARRPHPESRTAKGARRSAITARSSTTIDSRLPSVGQHDQQSKPVRRTEGNPVRDSMSTMDAFRYKGYDIPNDLMILTGAGSESWYETAMMHMRDYEQCCPIRPGHNVIEVGCGVGRDAMHLPDRLGADGTYLGLDVIPRSIQWCQDNISPRFPNFRFQLIDVHNKFYNPTGTLRASDVHLSANDASVDRILLQSVFTHMFEEDITAYLREFHRVLKPEGLVLATFFILDPRVGTHATHMKEVRPHPYEPSDDLTFTIDYGDGCSIQVLEPPEAAVAYTPEAVQRMLDSSRMELDQPIHNGSWSGKPSDHGQDIAVLRRRDNRVGGPKKSRIGGLIRHWRWRLNRGTK